MKIKIILTTENINLIVKSVVEKMAQGSIEVHDANISMESDYAMSQPYFIEVLADLEGALALLSVKEVLAQQQTLKADTEEQRKAIVEGWLADKMNLPWLKRRVELASSPTAEGGYLPPMSNEELGDGRAIQGWQGKIEEEA